jgi:hypothetical protein
MYTIIYSNIYIYIIFLMHFNHCYFLGALRRPPVTGWLQHSLSARSSTGASRAGHHVSREVRRELKEQQVLINPMPHILIISC